MYIYKKEKEITYINASLEVRGQPIISGHTGDVTPHSLTRRSSPPVTRYLRSGLMARHDTVPVRVKKGRERSHREEEEERGRKEGRKRSRSKEEINNYSIHIIIIIILTLMCTPRLDDLA